MPRNNNTAQAVNPFAQKKEVTQRIPEGNHIFKVDSVKENPEGPNMQMMMSNQDFKLVHTIFPSNVAYHIDTIGQQLEMKGEFSLEEVLQSAVGKELQVYISYNEYGRNVAFGLRRNPEVTEEEVAEAI